MVTLLSGRMPDQSDPGEVLASFTLAKDNGVRIGSVIQVPLASPAQLESGKLNGPPAARPALRVVGIVAAEAEFPSGASPHYDLYSTTAFAHAVNHRVALLSTYNVRLVHGAADLAGFDGRLRQLKLDVYGTLDLDAAAVAVEESIAPQVIGWYMLAGLAALAALTVIGQARPGRPASGDGPGRHGDGGSGAVRDGSLRHQPGAPDLLAGAIRRAVPGLLRRRRHARFPVGDHRAAAGQPEEGPGHRADNPG
jgi:hypothetical protein